MYNKLINISFEYRLKYLSEDNLKGMTINTSLNNKKQIKEVFN